MIVNLNYTSTCITSSHQQYKTSLKFNHLRTIKRRHHPKTSHKSQTKQNVTCPPAHLQVRPSASIQKTLPLCSPPHTHTHTWRRLAAWWCFWGRLYARGGPTVVVRPTRCLVLGIEASSRDKPGFIRARTIGHADARLLCAPASARAEHTPRLSVSRARARR